MTLATYTHTRPRGLAAWNPRKKTLALLADIQHVLTEYQDHLPLTGRQVFYRLVGTRGYPKDENAYSRLLETLNRARRAALVDWDAIRDDGVSVARPEGFHGKAGFWRNVEWWAEDYRVVRLANQPLNVEVWCEAGGMVPQLATVAHEFGVPVYSSGGFDSVTAKHDAAGRFMAARRPTVVLHIGDYDPSGLSVFDSAAEDITQMVCDLADGEDRFFLPEFVRVAVTPEQIERYALPGAPPKKSDRRGNWQGEAVQAESLDPAVLAELVREGIEAHLDLKVYRQTLEREEQERAELIDAVGRFVGGLDRGR